MSIRNVYIVCVIFVLLILVLYTTLVIFRSDLLADTTKQRQSKRSVMNDNLKKETLRFPETFNLADSLRRNCDTELVYSMSDAQCANICTGNDVFISRNGTCINSAIFSNQSTPSENVCDSTKGLLAYIIGDSQFGKAYLRCLSIDQGIQSDNANEPNKIISYATLPEINYNFQYPSHDKIKCDIKEYPAKIIIPNTESVRSKAVCVRESVFKIFI
ncbi:Pif-3 [Phenacoccus solenopsis nudivirus]|nr:Pif-3 [Phenacoccus solenopsis nudivirus]